MARPARYLWRANRQRLDAESLRDTILAVSGKLDLTMGGPSVEQFFFKDDHSPVYDYGRFDFPDASGQLPPQRLPVHRAQRARPSDGPLRLSRRFDDHRQENDDNHGHSGIGAAE